MGTTTTSSSPLAALAVLLLICSFHCAAAARLPPAAPLVRHEGGVEDAAHGPALAAGLSTSEVMTGAEEAEACEDDECAQRRLLRDAHLDYIYTQHKGKP